MKKKNKKKEEISISDSEISSIKKISNSEVKYNNSMSRVLSPHKVKLWVEKVKIKNKLLKRRTFMVILSKIKQWKLKSKLNN